MSILCKWFGHRPAIGLSKMEGEGYFEVRLLCTDGINRTHASLHCECERCGENYQVGKIHIPPDMEIIKAGRKVRPLRNLDRNPAYDGPMGVLEDYEGCESGIDTRPIDAP